MWWVPIILAALGSGTTGPASWTLVFCAPGYPGNTETAQPTMDDFAGVTATAAGLALESLQAVYFETAQAGLNRLQSTDAALAVVPLPFLLQYGEEKRLTPMLQVIPDSGEEEVWSLVARKGAVTSADSLAGWEVTGVLGYAPDFVRGPVLGSWGELPDNARVTFSGKVLGALRRVAAGEDLAVILDRTRAEAIPSLAFADDLEVVARSRPMPAIFLCTVGERMPAETTAKVLDGLQRLHKLDDAGEVLESMQVKRFQPVNQGALEKIRSSLPARAAASR